MGLFSTKYETTVSTQVNRVIDDKQIPKSAKSALIKAMFQGGEISDYLLEEMTHSVAVRAEKLFDYAQRSYTHGLPSGYAKDSTQGRPEAQAIFNAIEGQDVLIEYLHFGPPNTQHIGWMKLIAEHGYDFNSNKLGVLSDSFKKPVYLKDMVLVVPSSMPLTSPALAQWGVSPAAGYTPERIANTGLARAMVMNSPPIVDARVTEDSLRVTYVWAETVVGGGWDNQGQQVIRTGTFDIPVKGFDDNADYYHARYVVGDQPRYWMYKVGDGTYPTLDGVFVDPEPKAGSFFPFTYFRYFKTNIAKDKSTGWYKTSKKMLSMVGIDFDMVAEAIDKNPEVDDVEQAIMMFAVPANTQNEIERRYLYDFFEGLFESGGDEFPSGIVNMILNGASNDNQPVKGGMIIGDPIFKMAVANGGIYKKRKTGTFGPVGSHFSGFGTEYRTVKGWNENSSSEFTQEIPINYHFFRRQVSTGFYDEIEVVNLRSLFWVFGNYGTAGDGTNDILIIPVDRSISSKYTMSDREVLYTRAMHYVFNSRTVTPVKWYQSEFFQFVMIVVAVVITVYSFGTGGSALGTALAAGNYAAAASIIITSLVEYAITTVVVKLFVKAVGLEAALVIAAIAAAVGVLVKTDVLAIPGAPWAKDLLSVASNMVSGVEDSLKDAMKQLLGESNDFSLFMQKQTETLEKAKDLLDTRSNLLNPFVIFGEKPDDFYNRTVHSGNIGVTGLNAISNYVGTALKLPELEDTLGDSYA